MLKHLMLLLKSSRIFKQFFLFLKMAFIRQFGNDFFICSRFHGGRGKVKPTLPIRDIHLIKSMGSACYISLGMITFPKEWLGKRVRLKIELVEDKSKK